MSRTVLATSNRRLQFPALLTKTSIWRNYEQGQRSFGGETLPDGLKKNTPLPHALITPTTKAEKGSHDENVTRDQLHEREPRRAVGCILHRNPANVGPSEEAASAGAWRPPAAEVSRLGKWANAARTDHVPSPRACGNRRAS